MSWLNLNSRTVFHGALFAALLVWGCITWPPGEHRIVEQNAQADLGAGVLLLPLHDPLLLSQKMMVCGLSLTISWVFMSRLISASPYSKR